MVDKFEINGKWWIPDNPTNKILGTLKFDPNDGIILDILGAFQGIENFGKMFKPEIILGKSSDGKDITLSGCYERQSIYSEEFDTQSIEALKLFVGVHLQTIADKIFKEILVNYSYLAEWLDITGFDINYNNELNAFNIKYKQPKNIDVKIHSIATISIEFNSHHPVLNKVNEVFIKQGSKIRIIFEEDKSFEECLQMIGVIQNFLTLGISKAANPIEICAKLNDTNLKDELAINNNDIKIYYHRITPNIGGMPLVAQHMLFNFSDISDNFELYMANWVSKSDKLKSTSDLYFGTINSPFMYIQNKFLNFMEVLETYHRNKYEGKFISDPKWSALSKPIYEAIPKEIQGSWKQSLESRIRYGNEYSLRKRLKDLCNERKKILSKYIPDINTFINSAIDTRNNLIHHDPGLKDKALRGTKLVIITSMVEVIIKTMLIAEIGFSDNQIENLYSRFTKYGGRLVLT